MAAGSSAEELSFVDHFNRVMSNIATPTRLMFPWLDDLFPRKAVIDDVDALNARYDGLLQEKRGKPGRDILSYLLEDASLSHEELRSNLSILFSAGHVRHFLGFLFACTDWLAGYHFWRALDGGILPRA